MKSYTLEGNIGDYYKDYVLKALRLSKEKNLIVNCSFNQNNFIIKPDDSYDEIMKIHRQKEELSVSEQKTQKNINEMVEVLPTLISSIDDLLGWLVCYSYDVYLTIYETHRWKVIQAFASAGYKPKNKNIDVYPIEQVTIEDIVGIFMYDLIEHDFPKVKMSFMEKFVASKQYGLIKKSMDRKLAINTILETI